MPSLVEAGLAALEGFQWERPGGLWALALPLLVWMLSRLRARPPSRATGTFSLWKEVAGPDVRRSSRRRRGLPPAARWALAALVVGALALAGPRWGGQRLPRVWTVVVDHLPATSLPAPEESSRTRLDVALSAARDWLAQSAALGDLVRYRSRLLGTVELPAGEAPPAAWSHPSTRAADAPDWELFDEAGTLWVSDVAPPVAPRRAGLFTSGAAPAPGPIAVDRGRYVEWDGETVALGDATPARTLELRSGSSAELPEAVRGFAEVFAAEHGLVTRPSPGSVPALVIHAVGDGPAVPVGRVGRDGWWAAGTAAPGGVPARATDSRPAWLAAEFDDGRSLELVRSSPGEVRTALRTLGPLRGDPAAFAVSWGALLEGALLPAPGVVALADRQRVGERVARGTAAPSGRDASVDAGSAAPRHGTRLDAWLALAAALLGGIAVSWRGRTA